jgi:hypothetical protein
MAEESQGSPSLFPAGRSFRELLAANRSEIAIRVFRSAHELGIRIPPRQNQ